MIIKEDFLMINNAQRKKIFVINKKGILFINSPGALLRKPRPPPLPPSSPPSPGTPDAQSSKERSVRPQEGG